jgi:hypothetical protein
MPLIDLSDADLQHLLDELTPPINPGSGSLKQSLFQLERVGMIEVEVDGEDIVFKMPQCHIADLHIRRRGVN